ncbi:MAG: hypothetical protein Q9184_000657 [Pyrenodesmia sp. 2 TL-2023]
MTGSPPREPLSLFHEPGPDLRETEVDVRVTIDGFCNIGGLDHANNEDLDDLPTLEEVLRSAGETRKDASREHKEGLSESTTKEDLDESTLLDDDRSDGGDIGPVEVEARDDNDSSGYNSNGLTASEPDKGSNAPDTRPTSVSGSGDGYSPLREMTVHSTSNTPPLHSKDLLSSIAGKQVCESHDGDRLGAGPDISAGETREDQ